MSLKLSLMLNTAISYVIRVNKVFERYSEPGNQTSPLKGYQ